DSLLNHIHEGIYFVDVNRQIKFWNRGAEKITGYKADEMIGNKCSDHIMKQEKEIGMNICDVKCPFLDCIETRKHIDGHYYFYHKNGTRIPVWVNITPLKDKDDNIVGAIKIFKDDSDFEELKQIKEKLEETNNTLQEELETANIIQNAILSHIHVPDTINLDIQFKPHHSIGGDYYSVLNISKTKTIFIIGDITGKGIAASIMAGYIRNAIGTSVNKLMFTQKISPSRLLTEINKNTLYVLQKTNYQASLWCGIVDTEKKILKFSSAGHKNPILIRDNAQFVKLISSPLLGIDGNICFVDSKISLNAGNKIVLYTDGITDQLTDSGNRLSDKWLIELIEKNKNYSVEQLNLSIMSDIAAQSKNIEQSDDMLLVSLSINDKI
ncbi:MAG: SpoIIE family protein phosphatase, partial [Vampirovibrionia bacterium]